MGKQKHILPKVYDHGMQKNVTVGKTIDVDYKRRCVTEKTHAIPLPDPLPAPVDTSQLNAARVEQSNNIEDTCYCKDDPSNLSAETVEGIQVVAKSRMKHYVDLVRVSSRYTMSACSRCAGVSVAVG